MRLRIFISILLITFANVFILAHAVVPHYHHDGIVCLQAEKEDCQSCQGNDNGSGCCKSEGKHHAHLEDCDLPKVVERGGNPVDDIFDSFTSDLQFLICVCTLDCYSFASSNDAEGDKYRRYKNHVNTYTTPYVGSLYGLRAPPSSIIS